MRLAERLEGAEEEVGERLRVRDLLQLRHPLLVWNALGLQLLDELPLRPVGLLAQDDVGVLEDRLDDGDDVDGVGRRGGVEPLERRDGVDRERLVEGEVPLEVVGDDDATEARLLPRHPDDPGPVERPDEERRVLQEARLRRVVLVAAGDQLAQRREFRSGGGASRFVSASRWIRSRTIP